MDARKLRRKMLIVWTALGLMAGLISDVCRAATFQTRNFAVTADSADVAEKVGQKAEEYRRTLAIFWLGQALPNWSSPCKLKVREGAVGAGGQTTFQFVRGEVLNWNMFVQGSLERILDSVLPHEINHTIFACHFRRPLPRWADEGAATLFEHKSEQLKQLALLNEVIANDRERFTLRRLLIMKEYPEGMRPMLILYAQGYALADFLVQQRGRRAYLKFLSDGEKLGWEEAIRTNFDHDGIESLEKNWQGWVLAGMPHLTVPKDQMQLAQTTSDHRSAARPAEPSNTPEDPSAAAATPQGLSKPLPKNTTIRSQSQDEPVADGNGVSDVDAASAESLPREVSGSSPQPRRLTIQAPAPRIAMGSRKPTDANADLQNSADRVRPTAGQNSTGQQLAVQNLTAQQKTSRGQERAAWQVSVDGPELPGTLELPGERIPSEPSRIMDGQMQNLEPTGLVSTKSDEALGSGPHPTVSQFQSVPLPRERNVVSGSLPQWAGFPGQKKLF